LADPYYYHIDTCFCPLNDRQAIWYPEAFSKASQKKMAAAIDLIEVVKPEARRFACNAVVLGKDVIVPTRCPKLTEALEQEGFTVHACEVDEYIKSGGACKCLTMRID
jgi:N-dimethylarginine dimethylaminohydrolase